MRAGFTGNGYKCCTTFLRVINFAECLFFVFCGNYSFRFGESVLPYWNIHGNFWSFVWSDVEFWNVSIFKTQRHIVLSSLIHIVEVYFITTHNNVIIKSCFFFFSNTILIFFLTSLSHEFFWLLKNHKG